MLYVQFLFGKIIRTLKIIYLECHASLKFLKVYVETGTGWYIQLFIFISAARFRYRSAIVPHTNVSRKQRGRELGEQGLSGDYVQMGCLRDYLVFVEYQFSRITLRM